jgi:chromosomal replication initiator protein
MVAPSATPVSAQQLWQAALGELQMLVAAPVYENFLKGTTGARREDGTLVVAAPSDFVLGWLDTKLRPLLTQTVERLAGEALTLRFTVPGAQPSAESSVVGAESSLPPEPPAQDSLSNHSALTTQHAALKLNPAYTFQSFVVGTSNQLAHGAAQAVAATPGQSYNPLFLYGGVGLGKTHLLSAIGHEAVAQGLRVVYVSSEQFTNDFVNAIRDRRNDEFRARYRTADVLLIDDIQFIAGKEQTQEEFFHTFNDLHSARRQVVITSDRPPKSISLLEDRLVSRFEWGLIADVQPPDFETRLAILRSKAEEQRIAVPGSVLDFIAQRVSENIRELEGSLNRVVAFARLTGEDLSLTLAARALGEIAPTPRRRIPLPEQIIDAVADFYGLPPRHLAGQARDRHLVRARHVAMYLLRTDGARPLTEIGKMLGKRDHTTVMHGTEKIERSRVTVPELRGELAAIRAQLIGD